MIKKEKKNLRDFIMIRLGNFKESLNFNLIQQSHYLRTIQILQHLYTFFILKI